jgi:hypothetical protein
MTLALALAGGSVLAAAPALAQEEAEDAANTITAQVVDMSCYLAAGLKGADHKMCSEVCAKAGVPLVFLGEDGNLYLPISMAMPSASFNEKLIEHAEQKVKVTGKVVERSGSHAIVVDKIAAASY